MFYTKYTAKEIMHLKEAEILKELTTLCVDYRKEHHIQIGRPHTIWVKPWNRNKGDWDFLCFVNDSGDVIGRITRGINFLKDMIDFKNGQYVSDLKKSFISKSHAKNGMIDITCMDKGIITLEFDNHYKMYRFMNTVMNSPEDDSLNFGTSNHTGDKCILKRQGKVILESQNLIKNIPPPIQLPVEIRKQDTVISSNSTDILVNESDIINEEKNIEQVVKKRKTKF